TTDIGEELAVVADPALLSRAVREIVALTLKGVRTKTRIVVAAAADAAFVALTVRADVPSEPPEAATDGLGVRVVDAIARAHGGPFEPIARHAWKLCVPTA